MFHRVIIFLVLHAVIVPSSFGDAVNNDGEYAQIEADVEYVPINVNMFLGDVSGINSVSRCFIQCNFNGLCLTATYYEDLSICRLFSAYSFEGTASSRVNAKIITLVDRGKKHINKNYGS
jgi:hypothetical protein